jgi:hypothetical protein
MQRFCTLLLLLALFTVLFVGYFHPVTAINQDLGRHLLTGKIILQTQHVPSTNLFSYIYPDFPFINHHYLSEVVYALLFPLVGFSGLLWLTVGMMLVAFGLLVWQARKEASIIPLAFVSLLYLGVLFERTDIRPEIFSFFFLALFMVILMRYRERFTRWIFLLIPLELLWTNMHIYFPIGIGVIGLFLFEEIVRKRKNLKQKPTVILALVFLLCCLATLINPHGFAGATYPLHVFQNYGYTIEENQTMFFLEGLGLTKPSFLFFKLGVVVLFLSLLFSWKNTRLIDWLLALSFTVIAGSATRNFPLFVLATFLTATRSLSWLYAQITTYYKKQRPNLDLMLTPSLTMLLLGCFFLLGKAVITRNSFGDRVIEQAKNGVSFLQANKIKGPMFNNFDIGSYLEYRLYPHEKVFVDGRPEAYPASFFQQVYIPMQQDPAIFARVAKQYRFNVIFFTHADQTPWAGQFLPTIIHDPSWQTIYLDPYVIILVRNTPENKALIAQYGSHEKDFAMNALSPTDKDGLLHAANFYAKVGLTEQAKTTFLQILALDPSNCPVLANLIQLFQQQNDPLVSVYGQRYQQSCQ